MKTVAIRDAQLINHYYGISESQHRFSCLGKCKEVVMYHKSLSNGYRERAYEIYLDNISKHFTAGSGLYWF